MSKIIINKNRCKGCGLCVMYCPKKVLYLSKQVTQSGVQTVEYLTKECAGCGICAIICPDMAIKMVDKGGQGCLIIRRG
ncbi:hypothetical protein B9J78_01885 [bacterium Unc6]|nr:hypothetical protein [bacterium Unc6]